MKNKKSTDFDAQIEAYERKLKEWKSKRRALATQEARAAKKAAEKQETERLIAQGREADDVFEWMRSTSIRQADGSVKSVWDMWEQSVSRSRSHDSPQG